MAEKPISLATITYENAIADDAQQKTSRITPYVTFQPIEGESKRYQKTLAAETEQITTPHGATDPDIPDYEYRWVHTVPYNAKSKIAHEDLDKCGGIDDPVPAIARSHVYARNRRYDKVFVDALGADAIEGSKGNIIVPFDEQNTVPVGYAYSGSYTASGLTMDKVLEVKRIFEENEVIGQGIDDQDWAGTEGIIICSPFQLQQLLHDEKIINGDYSFTRPLQGNGSVIEVLGMRVVAMNSKYFKFGARKLGNPDDPTAGTTVQKVRTCYAYTPRSVVAASIRNPFTRVSELPEHNYNIQLYTKFGIGAARLLDKGVLKLDCLDRI